MAFSSSTKWPIRLGSPIGEIPANHRCMGVLPVTLATALVPAGAGPRTAVIAAFAGNCTWLGPTRAYDFQLCLLLSRMT
jgi:hypothetical protein